jgi:hypothetical protein
MKKSLVSSFFLSQCSVVAISTQTSPIFVVKRDIMGDPLDAEVEGVELALRSMFHRRLTARELEL